MQETPLQPEQMLVQTTPYCLHVQFFRAQSILKPYLTIFNNFVGATCLIILISIIPCFVSYPAGNYMLKVNNRNTRTRSEICSKLTIKIPERRQFW